MDDNIINNVSNSQKPARATSLWRKIWTFYLDGFKSMTVGKSLWILILIKIFVIFAVLKLFFFPDILSTKYDNDADRANAVLMHLTK